MSHSVCMQPLVWLTILVLEVTDVSRNFESKQQLMSQQSENDMVLEVCHLLLYVFMHGYG